MVGERTLIALLRSYERMHKASTSGRPVSFRSAVVEYRRVFSFPNP